MDVFLKRFMNTFYHCRTKTQQVNCIIVKSFTQLVDFRQEIKIKSSRFQNRQPRNLERQLILIELYDYDMVVENQPGKLNYLAP